MLKKFLYFLCAVLSAVAWTHVQAATTFQLNPVDGAIFGQPGESIGWGFTITNDAEYLTVTGSEFTGAGLGTYTDFIGQTFIVVGPTPENNSVTQNFDPISQAGIGSFHIDTSAVPGTTSFGEIILNYDTFSMSPNDPSFNPDTDTISTGNILTANASVTVATSTVPLPGTIWLMSSGLIVFLGAGSYKRKLSTNFRYVNCD